MGMHVMNVPTVARSALRADYQIGSGPEAMRLIQLQGRIRFAGVERVIREIVDAPMEGSKIALDVTRVYAVDEVAQNMLLELMRRLTADGYRVYLIDNDDTITDTDALRRMNVTILSGPEGSSPSQLVGEDSVVELSGSAAASVPVEGASVKPSGELEGESGA